MVGFNILKEKIHSFEEAKKIIRWDSHTLLTKAVDGKITPLIYMEWEGEPHVGAKPVLTPEGQSEWERIYGDKDIKSYPGFWTKPDELYLNKGSDWLTLSKGYNFSKLENQTSLPVVIATIFSHTTYPAPPKGHEWQVIFGMNPTPEISVENHHIREFDLKRIDSQFETDEEGKENRIWKIQLNKELSELKNLFEKLEFFGLFESESLERLYQHFNSFSLPDPVPDHATPLQWLGTWNSLVYVLRRLKGTEWIEATDKALEQNHFITKDGKPLKFGKQSVDTNIKDVKQVEKILKKHL